MTPRSFLSTMRLRHAAGASLLVLACAGPFAISSFAQTRFAQVSIEDALAGGVTVQGRVSDVFDDRVLLEDASGRVLVETAGAADKPTTFVTGQTLRIDGRLRGRII